MATNPNPAVLPGPAGPFSPGDPLAYNELDEAARAYRTLLHVLTVTGTSVELPHEYAPSTLALEVAAGWRYRPHVEPTATGEAMIISCGWSTIPAELGGDSPAARANPPQR